MALVLVGGLQQAPAVLPDLGTASVEVREPQSPVDAFALAAYGSLPAKRASDPIGGLTGTGGPGPLDAPPQEGVPAEGTASAAIEESTETPEPAETPGPLPIFYEYVVQSGDTASGIAAQFGIGTDYVVWNNVDVLADANTLPTGAVLQIPAVEGIIHSAAIGETVSGLAVKYDSTTEAIVEYEANGFGGDANNLPIGTLILIPGGRKIPPVAPEVEPPPPGDPSWTPPPLDAPPSWTPPPLQLPPSWVWPATGRLTSPFGPQHPLGIDISMVVSTPIAAATAGQVTFIGGNPCCSYGYHIIIEHADGFETLYAHLSQFYVEVGQWVNTGDIIGASGNTGYSTGPHLHFEVRQDGIHYNPLAYLP